MRLSLGMLMYSHHGSSLQSFSMDAASVAGLCMLVDLLDMHTPQHTCGVLQYLTQPSISVATWELAVLHVHVLPCFERLACCDADVDQSVSDQQADCSVSKQQADCSVSACSVSLQ